MVQLLLKTTLILYLLAFVGYIFTNASRKFNLKPSLRIVLFTAVLFQTVALGIRWYEAGHPPFRTLYESILSITWFLGISSIVFEVSVSDSRPLPFSLLLILIGLFYGEFMTSAEMAPLPPALQTYWFNIHVPTMLLSYAFFALSISYDIGSRIFPKKKAKKDYAYRLNLLGLPILGIGIMLGSAWANESWGAYWRWDPKEVWALITFLGYMAYLHVSMNPDWKRKFSFALNILGFIFVLFTYIGVNFITRIFSVESLHTF